VNPVVVQPRADILDTHHEARERVEGPLRDRGLDRENAGCCPVLEQGQRIEATYPNGDARISDFTPKESPLSAQMIQAVDSQAARSLRPARGGDRGLAGKRCALRGRG
jgi:hypothetical protein